MTKQGIWETAEYNEPETLETSTVSTGREL